MEKAKQIWDKLPKEIRILPYVAIAGAGTAVVKQLEATEIQNLIVMALINVLVVLLKERVPQIREKFRK